MSSTNRSPTILAIDTATEFCSVALLRGEYLIERALRVEQQHSEHVLPMVQAVLEEAQLPLSACDAIAFGAGPGGFTGLRIACGVTQGLAYAIDKPVVAVSNLAALALAAVTAGAKRRVLAAVDARMQEMYWAVIDVADDLCTEVAAPALGQPRDLAALAQTYQVDSIAGNALQAFADLTGPIDVAQQADARTSAAQIARLAQMRFLQGEVSKPADAAPLYVRDRVALTIQEREKAKSHPHPNVAARSQARVAPPA